MIKHIIIPWTLLVILVITYLVVTIRFSRKFRTSLFFKRKVRIFHLVMIWLIPFAWIILLKEIIRRTPGSYEVEIKEEPTRLSPNRIPYGLW